MRPHLNFVVPKLPAKDLKETKAFYVDKLRFIQVGGEYPDYLMVMRDRIELHFFLHEQLNVLENYGMCYLRVSDIEVLYQEVLAKLNVPSLGKLETKPWKQKEFSIIDPSHNLLTFGEGV